MVPRAFDTAPTSDLAGKVREIGIPVWWFDGA